MLIEIMNKMHSVFLIVYKFEVFLQNFYIDLVGYLDYRLRCLRINQNTQEFSKVGKLPLCFGARVFSPKKKSNNYFTR